MGLNTKALKEKQTRAAGKTWKPKNGDNWIRVLPPSARYFTEDLDDFAVPYNVHWIKVEGRDATVTRCYRDRGDRCPLCAFSKTNRDSEDPEVAKMAQEMRSTSRFVLNMLDIANPKAGLQVYEAGWKVYTGILGYAANPKYGDVISPTDGRNFNVVLTAGTTSRTNQYAVQPDIELTDISHILERRAAGWKEKLDDLASYLPEYLTEKQIGKLLAEAGISAGFIGAERRRGVEDEEDAPRPRGASRRQTEDDDEEEDDPPRSRAPRDEDEDDTPRRQGGTRRRVPDEDDDDEDDAPRSRAASPRKVADEEDEEEETPRARPSRRQQEESDEDDEDDAPRAKPGRTGNGQGKPPKRAPGRTGRAQAAPAEKPEAKPNGQKVKKGKTKIQYPPDFPAKIAADGRPVCYKDYDPERHPCELCPVEQDCQAQFLGIGGEDADD